MFFFFLFGEGELMMLSFKSLVSTFKPLLAYRLTDYQCTRLAG